MGERFFLPIREVFVSLDDRWLNAPREFYRSLGYTKKEFYAGRVREMVCQEDLEKYMSNYRRLINGKIKMFDMEKRYRCKNGEVIWTGVRGVAAVDPKDGKKCLAYYIRDITPGKQTVEKLRESCDQLAVRVRQRAQELKEFNRKLSIVHAECRKAEEALRGSEGRFRTLVENIPGVVYRRCWGNSCCDKGFFSEATGDITGYAASDFVGRQGRDFSEIVHPDDRQRVKKSITEALRRKESYVLEYRIICVQGKIRWVCERGKGIYDEKGNVRWLDGVILEITARKQAEEALQESEAQLREQKNALEQKNAALQEVLRQIEDEKRKKERDVMVNVERLIVPVIKKLKRKGSRFDRRYIDLLEKNVDELTSTFAGQISMSQWRLTPREMEICNMIKTGLPSKEIAELLSVSHRTVEIHRHSIRKKFGITNKDINLTVYLKSL